MLKRPQAILAATLAIGWTISANAAGTIGFSLSQQFDTHGNILSGCQLFTIQAGTTSTPQNAFKDTGLTIPHTNPILCDNFGRLPQFFLADGQIKVRLTDRNGIDQFVADNVLVIGPSAGGGGGGSVDPTTVLATGDFKAAYGVGPISGFVRCNGRTIGSAVSGASERANADTSSLFAFLWSADPNLAVSSGRGANPAADFAANKTLALPDCRGRTLAGLDDMGNSAAGRLTSAVFGTAPTTLGAAGGNQAYSLLRSDLPNVSPTFTGTAGQASSANANIPVNASTPNFATPTGSGFAPVVASNIVNTLISNFTPAGTIQSLNGGVTQTSIPELPPTILTTIYIKL